MYNNALCQHLNSSYTSRSLYGHIMWCQNRTTYSAFEMSSVTKLAFELTQCYTIRRHDNTSKSWLRVSVLCDGVVTLHSACAVKLLHMALSGHHNETLLCVFWRESFDIFSYRYQLQTVYIVDIFPWNFGVIQVRGFLTNYLDYEGNGWRVTNTHTCIWLIQYSRQTVVKGKLSKTLFGVQELDV